MKLKNNEKIILAVLLAVVIIAVGVFLLILPEYNKIEPNKQSLASAQQKRDELYQTLTRENTIDSEIQTALDKANKFSENFYHDLSTYEADRILRDILEKTSTGTYGMAISDYSTVDLTLEQYIEEVVTYPLKDYSGYIEPGIIDVSAYGITYDEDGNIVVPEGFTLEDTKDLLKEYMTIMLSTQTQTIGAITLECDVKGARKDFISFLDYVAGLDKATHIDVTDVVYSETYSEEKPGEGGAVGEIGEEGAAPAATKKLNGEKMEEFGAANILKATDTSEVQSSVTITFYCVMPPQFNSENPTTTTAAETEPAA